MVILISLSGTLSTVESGTLSTSKFHRTLRNLDYCIIQYTFYVNVVENFLVLSLLTELKDSLPEKMILFHTQLSIIIFWYLLLSGFESVLLFILNFLVQ